MKPVAVKEELIALISYLITFGTKNNKKSYQRQSKVTTSFACTVNCVMIIKKS